VQSVSESAKRWREGDRLANISRREGAPVGTTFSFVLNEPAKASFSFTQQLTGRRVGGRCVDETSKNRHGRRCERRVTAAGLSLTADTGTNKVVFDGRISRAKRLRPGAYTLTIRASDSAGASNAKQLTFTIVK
jgi:hypothetical protein